jgi:hypothetical protein
MAARLVAVRPTGDSREEAVEDPRSTVTLHRTILRPPAVAAFTAAAIPAEAAAFMVAVAEVAAIPVAVAEVADIRVGDIAKTLPAR